MRSRLTGDLPRLLPPWVGPGQREEGAGTPDPSLLSCRPRWERPKVGFWKGRVGAGAPWWPGRGWRGGERASQLTSNGVGNNVCSTLVFSRSLRGLALCAHRPCAGFHSSPRHRCRNRGFAGARVAEGRAPCRGSGFRPRRGLASPDPFCPTCTCSELLSRWGPRFSHL